MHTRPLRVISIIISFTILLASTFFSLNSAHAVYFIESTADQDTADLATFLTRDASTNYVVINESGITPAAMTIQVGERVTWHNATNKTLQLENRGPDSETTNTIFLPFISQESFQRQLEQSTANTVLAEPTSNDFGETIASGADYSFTFTEIGTYPYYVKDENRSAGTVIVEKTRPTRIIRSSPANGEGKVAITRETIIEFERPLSTNVIPDSAISARFGGQRLNTRLHVSTDKERITIHYNEPLPVNARVRVTVHGDLLIDDTGIALDPDGDGAAGGTATIAFDTLSLSRIPNTDVWGYVYDSYNKNDDGSERPVVGATIRLIGLPDLFAVTDAKGYFILENMPAPTFFVEIDGSTATNTPSGTTYASVGKPFHSIPGQSRQLFMDGEIFDIYLPTMASADVQQLSSITETVIGFGDAGQSELSEIFADLDPSVITNTIVIFPPNSAIDNNGNPTNQGAIIPVNAERLPLLCLQV